MSIDDRLRAGLPLVLDELLPDDVEQGLALTLRRVERRRGLRRGGYAVALVAAVAVVATVAVRVDDEPRSLEPVGPPTDQVLVLDSELGSPDEPAPLKAATYAIGFLGASDDAPWAEIEVPAGWGHDRLHPATGPDLDPHLRRIELSAVAMVAADPCEDSFAPVGPDVADLMNSLAAQRPSGRPGPVPSPIDGHAGQVLEVQRACEVRLSRAVTTTDPCALLDEYRWLPHDGVPRLDLPGLGARRRWRAAGHHGGPRSRRHRRPSRPSCSGWWRPSSSSRRALTLLTAAAPSWPCGLSSKCPLHERNSHVRTSDHSGSRCRRSRRAADRVLARRRPDEYRGRRGRSEPAPPWTPAWARRRSRRRWPQGVTHSLLRRRGRRALGRDPGAGPLGPRPDPPRHRPGPRPHLRRIEWSTVAMVAPDPCGKSTDPIGPEVDDLMTALAAQRTVRTEQPRPVSIGGRDGQQIHVRVPLDLDVTRWQLGGGLVPLTLAGGAHATVFPGWSYRVSALDVDGQRLVVLAAHGPEAPRPNAPSSRPRSRRSGSSTRPPREQVTQWAGSAPGSGN